MLIKKIKAIRVLDSRGVPTLKTFVYTDKAVGSAIVPSGTSSGRREALELRDKSKSFFGQDVTKAIGNINTKISKELIGKSVLDQRQLDKLMIDLDRTSNKSALGANAILSVSLASSRCACKELGVPLYQYLSSFSKGKLRKRMPKPILNLINGGLHAGNSLPFQEFQIIPEERTISENLEAACEIYFLLKDIISKKYSKSATNVGYEGGFAPDISDPKDALALLEQAIDKSTYTNVAIGLDCAASELYRNGSYKLGLKQISSQELLDYYSLILKSYNIKSIEDPFSEDDKAPWAEFTKKFSKKVMVIGDDLLVTNPKLISEAIKKRYCNSLLLKLNQIGTLTESIDAFNLARANFWKVIVSHRSGDSEDAYVSDLAFGLASEYCKFGAPARSERTAKYNRLIEIEKRDILENALIL